MDVLDEVKHEIDRHSLRPDEIVVYVNPAVFERVHSRGSVPPTSSAPSCFNAGVKLNGARVVRDSFIKQEGEYAIVPASLRTISGRDDVFAEDLVIDHPPKDLLERILGVKERRISLDSRLLKTVERFALDSVRYELSDVDAAMQDEGIASAAESAGDSAGEWSSRFSDAGDVWILERSPSSVEAVQVPVQSTLTEEVEQFLHAREVLLEEVASVPGSKASSPIEVDGDKVGFEIKEFGGLYLQPSFTRMYDLGEKKQMVDDISEEGSAPTPLNSVELQGRPPQDVSLTDDPPESLGEIFGEWSYDDSS